MSEPTNVLTQEKEKTRYGSPTLIIGLGGTGAEVLARVRDRFYSTFGALEDYPVVRYLWLDTDIVQSGVSNWYKRNEEIAYQLQFQPYEKVSLTVQDTESYLSHLDSHPHIARWIYPYLNSKTSINEGAGQIRAYGRLALFDHANEVRGQLQNALQAINTMENENKSREHGLVTNKEHLNVIIVASIAGGTGSGTFLDMAYLVRQQLKRLGIVRKATLMGYLVTPSVFGGTQNMQRLYANGYAALKELNHFNYSPPEELTAELSDDERENEHNFQLWYSDTDLPESIAVTPFDVCYMVDGTNLAGYQANDGAGRAETIFSMVADNIVQDFQTSEFAQRKRSHRDNLLKDLVKDAKPLLEVATDVRLPKRHFAFGMSSITFPYDRVRRACAAKLAGDIVDYWMRKPDRELEATDFLKERFLGAIGMEELLGSATRPPKHDVLDALYKAGPTQTLHFELQREVSDMCTTCRETGTDKNNTPWGVQLREVLGRIDRGWAGEDTPDKKLWGDWVRRMRQNQEEYLITLRQRLAEEVLGLVNNEHRGIGFAMAVLDALDHELSKETDGYMDVWRADQKNFKEARQAMRQEMESQLTALNQQWDMSNWHFLRGVTLEKTLQKFEQAAVDLYMAQVEFLARSLAIQVAAEVRKWISKEEPGGLRSRFDRLQRDLIKIKEQLAGRVNAYAEATRDDRHILLYDGPKELEAIYKQFVPDPQEQAKVYNEQALQALGFQLMDLQAGDVEGLCDKLTRTTVTHFRDLEEKYDALSRFIAKFPIGSAEWFEKIDQMIRACQPWVAWEQSFIGLRDKMGGDKGRFLLGVSKSHPQYNDFMEAVKKRVGVSYQVDFVDLNSRSQIVFYTEVAGFALCQTTAIKPMREQYYKEIAENNRNDLHTDKRDSRFGELVVLSSTEQKELRAAWYAFLTGTIMRLIVPQERKDRKNTYVTYVYKQRGTGLFAESRYLGVEDAVVPFLRSKKESLLNAVYQDIQLRWAALQENPDRWAEYAAVLEYYRTEYYPARQVNLGNGQTETIEPLEYKILQEEYGKVAQLAWPDFKAEVLRKYKELKSGKAAWALTNAAGRIVLNLPTVDEEQEAGFGSAG